MTVARGGDTISISNNSTLIVPVRPWRQSVTIQNLSTTAMLTVSIGKAAQTKKGYNLAPAADGTHPGGMVILTDDDAKDSLYGIMSTADATENVSVVEE